MPTKYKLLKNKIWHFLNLLCDKLLIKYIMRNVSNLDRINFCDRCFGHSIVILNFCNILYEV